MADNFDESIKTLMEVTGLDFECAKKVFKFKENNLDQAINYILDGNPCPENSIIAPKTSADGPSTSFNTVVAPNLPILNFNAEDEVRAPIPPKRETMILPEEDNFRFRKRRQVTHNLCPLRNFEREGELLEEELLSLDRTSRTYSRKKRVRLEDIFRPPVDICFCGTFQAAREYATEQNQWLIINVQDHKEFLSQCLNRDVWSNVDLKTNIKEYFVFLQVSVDNSDGMRFKTFYSVESCPYVCIIDPRTGEHKMNIKSLEMKPEKFMKDFYMFLKENGPYPCSSDQKKVNGCYEIVFTDIKGIRIPFDDDIKALPIPSTSQTITQNNSHSAGSASSSVVITDPEKKALHEIPFEKLTEEEQIELAIKKSLSEADSTNSKNNGGGSELIVGDSDDELDGWSDDEELSQKNNYEKYLGPSSDPKTKLQLRLPNECREILEWPTSSKIRALILYLKLKYPEITRGKYKILNISTFPKRNLLELDEEVTFDKCDLHRGGTLYIHQDD